MKAIWSKKFLTDEDDNCVAEFMSCINDLLIEDCILALDDFVQHFNTSRLQHSLNVAYYSFLWAKRKGLDYKSVARAGILHDLYLYDWKITQTEENHVYQHPKEALKNAEKICTLNDIERDAILNHMWPLCKEKPKYKETYILSWVDKYCAFAEVMQQSYNGVGKLIFSR